jgi:hypothetical protein
VLGYKLSLVRLCDSDFGIIPVDDITIGITCAAFCFHIAHISFASYWYLFCLSAIVLVRLCVFGTAVAQWLRYCATNRKVAGSIPDGVTGIFH